MVIASERELAAMPDLTPRAELVLLARALHRDGWDDPIVGHITYRQPDDTFLALPKERGWDEVRPEDVLRIDLDGNQLEGPGTVNSAILLHLEFHRARPGCHVTVHQHPRFTTIWSAAGRIPPVYDSRAAFVPDEDISFYDDYEGGVHQVDAARAAVAGMGDSNCAILRNHGAFIVGESMAQTYSRALSLEWRCRQAWYVEAIGAKNVMPDVGQDFFRNSYQTKGGVQPNLWPWAVRRELRADPSLLR